jgi:hypothetical protein
VNTKTGMPAPNEPPRAFRFSLDERLGAIVLEQWEKMLVFACWPT